ncbi:MAG TPA: adenylate/guanylate cyclase domain-containing protein [Candidatus Limnocylindria bacterium]|nr:adenylate/guanylate cyclase domain-containing protein [Candidatus Limnocylindria bacterium]
MASLEFGSRAPATVAFLFADLEGSTRLLASLGAERYGEVLSDYRLLLAEAAAPEGGEVVDREGDGLFLVFPTAAAAIRAAARAQQALGRHAWPPDADVAARIGVHAGEARRDAEGMLGLDVHRASRVASAAHGGQVLVSETARLLSADGLPDELQLLDLGQHRLKDLTRSERLHQLIAPGMRRDFAPPRTLEGTGNNLPVQTTSFVGRHAELAEVLDLLRRNRLLTITGVGGSGKTRLAVQAGAELLPDCRDGVWLVELGGVTDPDLVDGALLDALSVSQGRGVGTRESIIASLATARALLILDNCEHLLDASADLVSAVVAAAPDVSIVATSRELLGVAGEVVYGLRSMSLPADEDAGDPGALATYDAVRLFSERANAVLPGFQLKVDNVRAVTEICRRLDGMPLALELAAARLRAFSPEKLAELLDQRFRLLTGGSRTALPRQQTLKATIEWSYRLLSEAERRFFRLLSVFQGGFSYEAAVAVATRDDVAADVLELLPALVDKSLLLAEDEAGEVRYRLLETIRQYARDRLDEAVEGDVVRGRHAAYYRQLSAAASQHAFGPDEVAWHRRVDADSDNLRQAMTWSLEAGQPAAALEIAIGFARFAGWSESLSWLDRALVDAWATADRLTRARMLTARGRLRDEAGKFDDAEADLEQAIELFRELDAEGTDPGPLIEYPRYATAYISLAVARFHHGRAGANNELFTELVQEALAIARRLGDRYSIAAALGNLAHHMDPRGDPAKARELFAEAVAATRALGSDQGLAGVSQQRAFFEWQAGDIEASRQAWLTAIRHAELGGEAADALVYRAYLAAVEVELGADPAAAAASFASHVSSLTSQFGARQGTWVYQTLIVCRAGIDAARRDHRRVALGAGASAAEAERGTPVRWDLAGHFDRVTGQARQSLGEEEFALQARRGAAMSREEIAPFLSAD